MGVRLWVALGALWAVVLLVAPRHPLTEERRPVGDAVRRGGGRRTGVRECRGTDAPPTRPWLPGPLSATARADFDAHHPGLIRRTLVARGRCR